MLRPKQWSKNVFCFAGLIFGGKLFHFESFFNNCIVFLIFCCASSAVYIFNDISDIRANQFINDLQKIVSYILQVEGFSVGISDMIADESTNNQIKTIITERKQEIDKIMQEVHLDIFEGIPGQTKQSYFESKVNSLLNKIINETGKTNIRFLCFLVYSIFCSKSNR